MDLAQAVNYGKRVAGNLAKGCIDAQAAATTAAWRAYDSYDGSIPMERYVAVCVKRAVWDMWRRKGRRGEKQQSEVWWAEVYTRDGKATAPYEDDAFDVKMQRPPVADLPEEAEYIEVAGSLITRQEWLILYEHFVENMPFDVIARRCGHAGSFHQLRKVGRYLVKAALSEL